MRTLSTRLFSGMREKFLSQGRMGGRRKLLVEGLEDRQLLASDLAITKVDSPDPITPGEFVTYTLVATNNGPDAATATIADSFAASLSAVSFTSSATGGASGNTASGTGNISNAVTMPSGSTITYTVVALVSPTATGSISNTAPEGCRVTLIAHPLQKPRQFAGPGSSSP